MSTFLLLELWTLLLKGEIPFTTSEILKRNLRQEKKNCIFWFRNINLSFFAIMVTPARTYEKTNSLDQF